MTQLSSPDDLLEPVPAQVADLESLCTFHHTPCGEGRMVWREWGEGPAVALFHGNYGSWTHWLKTIPELAKSYRVIVPDAPGFGDSDLPPEPWSFDSVTDILRGGLERIARPDETIAFAGFSFGSHLAAYCARALRERARKTILVSCSNIGVERSLSRPTGVSWRRLSSRQERDAAHRRNLEIMMFHDPAKIDDLAVRLQRDNAERARVGSGALGKRQPLVKVLAEAGCEISGIWGDQDPRCAPHLDTLYQALNQPQCVIVRGTSHWVPYEAPDRFNTALLAMLEPGDSPMFARDRRIFL